MKKVSAVLITYNEEDKIQRALDSLQAVSDEIVVVDSDSTDATVEFCSRYTNRILTKSWQGYRDQKRLLWRPPPFVTDSSFTGSTCIPRPICCDI